MENHQPGNQRSLWITNDQGAKTPDHPLYRGLGDALQEEGFDAIAGMDYAPCITKQHGRPGRKRVKKESKKEWKTLHVPDTQITKLEDDSTHLVYTAVHTVGMRGIGEVLRITLHDSAQGYPKSLDKTMELAWGNSAERSLWNKSFALRPPPDHNAHGTIPVQKTQTMVSR